MRRMRAQGATEYLVLLAVVLIVALVSVALLGFFPGMASDAQIAQSQAYWSGASPIAIAEVKFVDHQSSDIGMITALRLKNTGAYAVRVKKLLSEGTWANNTANGPSTVLPPIDFYLAPGEEKWLIKWGNNTDNPNSYWIGLANYAVGSGYHSYYLRAAQPCAPGELGKWGSTAILKEFGFEYEQYVDGQTMTKREIGSEPLIGKCMGDYNF